MMMMMMMVIIVMIETGQRLAKASSSSSSNLITSESVPSSSTTREFQSTSVVSFPSFTRDFASYSSSTLSFRADFCYNNQLIINMFYKMPSLLMDNLIKGTMFLFKLVIDYLPSQMINNHHNQITINSWFHTHPTLCPLSSSSIRRSQINSRCSSTFHHHHHHHHNSLTCQQHHRITINQNKTQLPDLIPINDNKRRENRSTIKSSTSLMIVEVASDLKDLSNKFDSFHCKLRR